MLVAFKLHLLANSYKSLILRNSLFDPCKKPKTWENLVQMLVALKIHLLDKSLISHDSLLRCFLVKFYFCKDHKILGKLVVNACGIEVSLTHKLSQVFNITRLLVAL